MSISKKACLFCGQIAAVAAEDGLYRFSGCRCAPAGFYQIEADCYDEIRAMPFGEKIRTLPLLSGYIRETLELGEAVTVTSGELQSILLSPRIPATLAEKGRKLLGYLRRHAGGPGEPVTMPPLATSFNVTYSPNQQELVFLMEKLREEKLLEREGTVVRLTASGWREAAVPGGGDLPPCFVWLPDDERARGEWEEKLLPKLRQCGYAPALPARREDGSPAGAASSLTTIDTCKLLVVDVTGRHPGAYLAGGYAMGRNIPVIWTAAAGGEPVRHADAGWEEIRPIGWTDTDQLALLLEQRLAQ